MGATETARSNSTPSDARRSKVGVRAAALPYAPRWSARVVSRVTRRIFGLSGGRDGQISSRHAAISPKAVTPAATNNRILGVTPLILTRPLVETACRTRGRRLSAGATQF